MTTNIRIATDLWLEAGPASNSPHHHIELPDDLAQFFDPAARDAEVIHVRLPNGRVVPRPLTFRGADDGLPSGSWTLALPTERQGGPPYAGRVIRLTQDQEGTSLVYRLDVADAHSAATREWDVTARSSGNIGTTAGPHGRRYGYW
jgi:hypothetical protein